MINSPPFPLSPPDASQITPIASSGDPQFAHRWLQETWLTRLRWWCLPLGLVLIPLFPAVSGPLTLILLLGLALSNAWLCRLLRQGYDPARLRLVCRLASTTDWLAVLGLIVLHGRDPSSGAQALPLVLLVLTGMRYRWRGVLVGATGAGLIVAALVGTQLLVLDLLDPGAALRSLVVWELLVGLMALTVGGLVGAGGEWFRWEEARWAQQSAALQRLQSGLSPQEWRVLSLLAQEDLTYQQVAQMLHISPVTVKTHVRRIGGKLGVSGRRPIVAAAREQGMVPPAEAPPMGNSYLHDQRPPHRGLPLNHPSSLLHVGRGQQRDGTPG